MLDLEARLTADLTDAAQAADPRPPGRQAVTATVAQRRHRRRVRTTVLAVAATVVVAAGAVAALGAGRDDDQTVTHQPTTTVPTTAVPPSSEVPVPTSSTASTTSSTTAPTASDDPSQVPISESLVLRPGGIGPFDFGAPQAEVMPAVSAELGEPYSRFPHDGVAPECEPAAEEVAWEGLIVRFEGPNSDSLRLTAWSAGYGNPWLGATSGCRTVRRSASPSGPGSWCTAPLSGRSPRRALPRATNC